jgi:hypothetical protein
MTGRIARVGVLIFIACLALAATAAAKTVIYSNPEGAGPGNGDRWVREPERLAYVGGPATSSSIELRRISWHGWGQRRATGVATFLRCHFERCRATDARLTASDRTPDAAPGNTHVYRRLKITYGNRAFVTLLPIPNH